MRTCNICDMPTKLILNTILYANGSQDLEQYNYCVVCKHVVDGNIKRVKEPDVSLNHKNEKDSQ